MSSEPSQQFDSLADYLASLADDAIIITNYDTEYQIVGDDETASPYSSFVNRIDPYHTYQLEVNEPILDVDATINGVHVSLVNGKVTLDIDKPASD